ncbi:uncharacterized protein rab11fip5a [Erpetoichthys calabaricus]|uniref:uncharacterized protein rab11fip5a n=1 Tax=Erpetoichthys calabaricus TaxID=27687 RepID=UPI00109FC626|nr:uncharacterized protein rab11fip5a [Erpetoichthys calabaricus]
MSLLGVDDEQRWLPTHVQVTVLRARGLRAKGKHGTSDVYTIMQLGKEKYCTSVKEKELNPEWMEECSFELHPGVLEGGPPGGSDLLLTVMHRALIGMDSFLGQVVVPLDRVFQERMSRKNEWFKLHSKVGKKEKERGEIQVTVQFTRNNLTASMYDLSIKDKPRSTLGKLKDKMKGKKSTESSSAIVPSAFGALSGKGGREIDEDDEEDDEQHEEGKRSKVKGFFKKQRLRKSSDTHSNASVASTNSVSSSPGGSLSPTAGISVVVSDLSNSPSLSSNLTVDSPIHTAQSSPKLQTHKRAFSDEVNQTGVLLQPKEVQNLKSKGEPLSKSSLCINGSHVYTAAESTVLPGAMGVLQKSSPLSRSLQNLPKKGDDSHKADHDGRRWSLEKPKKNNDAKSPINLGEMAKEASLLGHPEGKPVQIATPIISIGNEKQTEEGVKEEHKKNKLHLFSHGSGSKSDSVKSTEHGSPSPPHKTWFGSKDSQHKPSSSLEASLAASSWSEEHRSAVNGTDLKADPSKQELNSNSIYLATAQTSLFRSSTTVPESTEKLNLEYRGDWDESFDAFAASRLKPTKDIEAASGPKGRLELSNADTNITVTELSSTNKKSCDIAETAGSYLPPVPLRRSLMVIVEEDAADWTDRMSPNINKNEKHESSLTTIEPGSETVKDIIQELSLSQTTGGTSIDLNLLDEADLLSEYNDHTNPCLTLKNETSETYADLGKMESTAPQSMNELSSSSVSSSSVTKISPRFVSTWSTAFMQKAAETLSEDLDRFIDNKTKGDCGPLISNWENGRSFGKPSELNDSAGKYRINESDLSLLTAEQISGTRNDDEDEDPSLSDWLLEHVGNSKNHDSTSSDANTANPLRLPIVSSHEPKFISNKPPPDPASDMAVTTISFSADALTKTKLMPENTEETIITEGMDSTFKVSANKLKPKMEDSIDMLPTVKKADVTEEIVPAMECEPSIEVETTFPSSVRQVQTDEPLVLLDNMSVCHDNVLRVINSMIVCAEPVDTKESFVGKLSSHGETQNICIVKEDLEDEDLLKTPLLVTEPVIKHSLDLEVTVGDDSLPSQFLQSPAKQTNGSDYNPTGFDSMWGVETVAPPKPERTQQDVCDVASGLTLVFPLLVSNSDDHMCQKSNTSSEDGKVSSSEVTDVDHYKTCKSKLSLEELDLVATSDSNLRKRTVFPAPPCVNISEADKKPNAAKSEVCERMSIPCSNGEKDLLAQPGAAWRKSEDDLSNMFWTTVDEHPQTLNNDTPHIRAVWVENVDLGLTQQNLNLKQTETDEPCESFASVTSIGGPFLSSTEQKHPEESTANREAEFICVTGQPSVMSENLLIKTSEEAVLQATQTPSVVFQEANKPINRLDVWRSSHESFPRHTGQPDSLLTQALSPPVFSSRNPFVHTPPSYPSSSLESSSQEGLSFKDLHVKVAPPCVSIRSDPGDESKPFLHDSKPLAASTPSLVAVTNSRLTHFPSPILSSLTEGPPAGTSQAAAPSSSCPPPPIASALTVLPEETQPAENVLQRRSSPHPVKPLNTSVLEKHDSGVPTGLDKLKSTIQPIFQLSHGQHKDNTVKAEIFPESAAQYYHLTHDELILLLLQKEAELEKTKMELQKKMAKVSDLEEYIDTLLVRIMEQTPALLQVPVHSSKSTSK